VGLNAPGSPARCKVYARLVITYFGQPWDAPMFDDAEPWPESVVGWTCIQCDESVQEGDSGLVMPYARLGPPGADGEPGKPLCTPGAVHKECHLRAVLGSIEHLEGRCGVCHGSQPGQPHDHEASTLSYRGQARAVVAWLAEQGR
jgi:hypothetical protein